MKWEYLVEDLGGLSEKDLEGRLDVAGADGWELVSVIRREAIFKREVVAKKTNPVRPKEG